MAWQTQWLHLGHWRKCGFASSTALRKALGGDPVATLTAWLRDEPARRVCVIVDQLEELVTLAPEAGSERLRALIRKDISTDDVMRAADLAARYHICQVPMVVHFGDEAQYSDANIDHATLFGRVDRDGRLPTTSPPSALNMR